MRADREPTQTRCALWLGFALLVACGDDDVAVMQLDDGRPVQDAAPVTQASGRARLEPDTSVPAEPVVDSGSAADAAADAAANAAMDGGPLTGCNTAADCAIPEAALACRCARDVGSCYQATCVDHACGIVRTSLCPDERDVAAHHPECTSDGDCMMDGRCNYRCRDGSPACLGVACVEGLCITIQGSCGVEACPEGTIPAHDVCGKCGLVGGCQWLENGCFPVCGDGYCPPAIGCV